jgi:uncharacterized surface protein with fasciclin (FAS1) repeats
LASVDGVFEQAGRAPRPVSVRAVLVADAEKSTFVDLARENPSFSILSQAIENAGVGDTLNTVRSLIIIINMLLPAE